MPDESLHNQIMRALGNLEGKVDGINSRLDKQNNSLMEQGGKIGVLESQMASIKTKSAILWGGATLVALAVWEYFRRKLFG